jgi:hypothetical protein
MRRLLARLLGAAALLAAPPALAASLTPPNLTAAVGIAPADLLLIWPTASVGPLESLTYTTLKGALNSDLTFLKPSNNLSDLGNPTTARTNLGLTTAAITALGTSGATIPLLSTANTWTLAQTFTVAPVFTAQANTRTALGLGTAATQNTGTSGANVGILNANNTYGASTGTTAFAGRNEFTGNTGTTISSCGTSPGGTTYDNKGAVSIGSGTVTACTVTFHTAFASAPVCVVSMYSGTPSSIEVSVQALSTTGFTVGFSANAASSNFTYLCF